MGRSIDANGWTIITPSGSWVNGFTGSPSSSDTRIIFVSSSTGFDTDGTGAGQGNGSSAHPYATITKGMTRIRGGSPDWLLLALGDTWTGESPDDTSARFGPSATEPFVISNYDRALGNNPPIPNPGTSGARPRILTTGSAKGIQNASGNTVIIGVEIKAINQDPGGGSYSPNGAEVVGISTGFGARDFLTEDCEVSWYTKNISYQPDNRSGGGAGNNMHCRRCVIRNAWDTTTAGTVSDGFGSGRCVSNNLVEENIFDHNGWNTLNVGSFLNHSLYLTALNIHVPADDNLTDLHLKGNINSNTYWLEQGRSGGNWYNNLLWAADPVNNDCMTTYNISNPSATNRIDSNVLIGRGVGFGFAMNAPSPDGTPSWWAEGPAVVTNNIFTQGSTASCAFRIGNAGTPSAWDGLVTSNNNIAWKYSSVLLDDAISPATQTGYNICTSTNTFGWPYPDRTPATYMHEIIDGAGIGTGAGSRTDQDFIDRCLLQRKGNWNPLLMAESYNDYQRQGFGVAMVGSAYADLVGGTPPVLMAQICM